MAFKQYIRNILLLLLGDIVIVSSCYLLSAAMWFGSLNILPFTTVWAEVLFLMVYLLIFYLMDLYNLELIAEHGKYLFRHVIAVATSTAFLALLYFAFPVVKSGRVILTVSTALGGLGTYGWRHLVNGLFRKRLSRQQRILIVGVGKAAKMLYETLTRDPEHVIVGLSTDDGRFSAWQPSVVPTTVVDPESLRELVRAQQVNTLVLAITHFKDPALLKSALECKLDGVMVYDMPSYYEMVTGKVPVEHVTDYWLIFTPLLGVKRNVYNKRLKRSLDILLALTGLALSFPLSLCIAGAVKLESRGPVLFRQRRVGLNGREFTLLKFRSMTNGKDFERQQAGKKSDPRITRVGRVLRHFRMDEIPQMWNVLKGDMSFIGPRALMAEEVSEFDAKIPYFSLRHSIRPGITGWAQVRYRHGASIEDGREKLQYDLFYIKNLSPFLDFVIFLDTIKVVLSGKGAQ